MTTACPIIDASKLVKTSCINSSQCKVSVHYESTYAKRPARRDTAHKTRRLYQHYLTDKSARLDSPPDEVNTRSRHSIPEMTQDRSQEISNMDGRSTLTVDPLSHGQDA